MMTKDNLSNIETYVSGLVKTRLYKQSQYCLPKYKQPFWKKHLSYRNLLQNFNR